MEQYKPLVNLHKFRLSKDLEDYAQECNAYMKIKYFMSKRIVELEHTVEDLTARLAIQATKNAQLMDWQKSFNTTLNEIKIYSNINAELSNKEEQKALHMSSDFIDSVILVDNDNNANIEKQFMNLTESPKNRKGKSENSLPEIKPINDSLMNKVIQEYETKFTELKNENIELAKQNHNYRNELISKNLQINKILTEKMVLINELTELLNSLGRVNKNSLQKFYKENSDKSNLRENDVPSCLGIKYNILSAYSHLGMFAHGDTNNFNGHKDNIEEEVLNLDKFKSVMKVYEEEFNRLISNNLKKSKIIQYSDSE